MAINCKWYTIYIKACVNEQYFPTAIACVSAYVAYIAHHQR